MTRPRRPCRPCSRPSRRRCFLASRRVEPLTPWTPPVPRRCRRARGARGSVPRCSADRPGSGLRPRLHRGCDGGDGVGSTRSPRRHGRRGRRRSCRASRTPSRPRRRIGHRIGRPRQARPCSRSASLPVPVNSPWPPGRRGDRGHHDGGGGARRSLAGSAIGRFASWSRRHSRRGWRLPVRRSALAGTAFSALGGWKSRVGIAAGRLGAASAPTLLVSAPWSGPAAVAFADLRGARLAAFLAVAPVAGLPWRLARGRRVVGRFGCGGCLLGRTPTAAGGRGRRAAGLGCRDRGRAGRRRGWRGLAHRGASWLPWSGSQRPERRLS